MFECFAINDTCSLNENNNWQFGNDCEIINDNINNNNSERIDGDEPLNKKKHIVNNIYYFIIFLCINNC